MATIDPERELFLIEVLGIEMPGDVLQVPLLVVMARVVLMGLGRRLAGGHGDGDGRVVWHELGLAVEVRQL